MKRYENWSTFTEVIIKIKNIVKIKVVYFLRHCVVIYYDAPAIHKHNPQGRSYIMAAISAANPLGFIYKKRVLSLIDVCDARLCRASYSNKL